ncbi:hypothetical protein WM40_22820 [Robbsia andropogonis]|uniref:Uncharacterized protein n=1 Tax=Robbsia andropogonis TaxID=28092 RepID=A0A0F5JUH8_9BURK|nr:hypothetical protein WM40_22820 [Robbsia andropogonis]
MLDKEIYCRGIDDGYLVIDISDKNRPLWPVFFFPRNPGRAPVMRTAAYHASARWGNALHANAIFRCVDDTQGRSG